MLGSIKVTKVLNLIFKNLFSVYGLLVYMYVYARSACLKPEEARRRHHIVGTELIDGHGSHCGCWDMNLGPL